MSEVELTCHMKSYIQPFERGLAREELRELAGTAPVPQDADDPEALVYRVTTRLAPDRLLDRLTYWERVYVEGSVNSSLTRQVRREATTQLSSNGHTLDGLKAALPFGEQNVSLHSYRNLRYGPHGIHEYRGKFFPQLVRSLLNIAGATPASTALDPMSGSGTAPTEAVLAGCRALGIDYNPLSVLISRVKSNILSADPDLLVDEYRALKNDLLAGKQDANGSLPWFGHLSERDREYLERWFAPEVLAHLDPIIRRLEKIKPTCCRELFLICLSNILRRISWQKEADLRVRKEIPDDLSVDVKGVFLEELDRVAKDVLAFLYEIEGSQLGRANIIEGDARRADVLLAERMEQIDVIITSPPYATALPYLSTDRLSLHYLNLLSRADYRHHNFDMIGNREINKGHRQRFWKEFQANEDALPGEVARVIRRIRDLNEGTDAGFRRQNLPALLARYFLDMRKVFETFLKLLRSGAPAYVVVGNNHTVAGGERVDIETNQLLAQLGEQVGLVLEDFIPMDMLVSRDIFKKNSGSAESILCFRKA